MTEARQRTASWHLLVAGSLAQRTGGYRYDARITGLLRQAGHDIRVHELTGRFPALDAVAGQSLDTALRTIADGDLVVLDGLAAGAHPDILAAHADRLRLIALVHHPLGDEAGLEPARREQLLAGEVDMLRRCRRIIVTSDHTRRRLAELGIDANRIRVVVPGTDPVPQTVAPPPPPPVRLLCVAAVIPRKAQHVLLQALAGLRDLCWECVLVGSLERDPDYAARLLADLDRLGLQRLVRLPGELDEAALEREYARAHLFVLPSSYEGYGMVLTEAMSRGLPVVATTGGAIPDTVPPTAGLLVPPGDAQSLAAALRRCLEDSSLRASLARGGRSHSRSLPDWPATSAAFAAALDAFA